MLIEVSSKAPLSPMAMSSSPTNFVVDNVLRCGTATVAQTVNGNNTTLTVVSPRKYGPTATDTTRDRTTTTISGETLNSSTASSSYSDSYLACGMCPFTMPSKSILECHNFVAHPSTLAERSTTESTDIFTNPISDKEDTTEMSTKSSMVNSNSNKLKCAECTFTSHLPQVLERHQATVHTTCQDYQCNTCKFRAASSGVLRIHERVMHSALPESSNAPSKASSNPLRPSGIAGRAFPNSTFITHSPQVLERHQSTAHTTCQDHQCSTCEFRAATSGVLRIHERVMHSALPESSNAPSNASSITSSPSGIADRAFPNRAGNEGLPMRMPTIMVANANGESALEIVSLRGTLQPDVLESLPRKKQNNNANSNSCPSNDTEDVSQRNNIVHACLKCAYRTHSKGSLYSHVKMHETKETKKKVACPECSVETHYPKYLKRHITDVHKKKVMLSCGQCIYVTARKGNLKVHNKSHHPNEDTDKSRWKACSSCDFRAATWTGVRLHEAAVHHHGQDQDGQREGRPCLECSYRANSKTRLRMHTASVHRKEKAFSCEECDFRTATRASLNCHRKRPHSNNVALSRNCKALQLK